MKLQYNFQRYWTLNFFSILNFETLLDYVNDEDSMRLFTNKHGWKSDEQGNIILIPEDDDSRQTIHSSIKKDVISAIEVMNNQVIVYMATIIEASISDFFYCIFAIDPQRMKTVKSEDRFGFSYEDFIKHESKDQFLLVLARRAAGIYSSGTIHNIIKRMTDISGLTFEIETVKIISKITSLRNEIVHENKHHDFKIEMIKKYSETIDQFIKCIARKLVEMNVDVIDPGDLLDLSGGFK